jgi:berberine-like enzyme
MAEATDAPDELLWTSFLRRAPEVPWIPPELAGTRGVMSLIEWSGDPREGRALLSLIRRQLQPAASSLDDVPYLTMQRITDELLAPGTLHAYVKAGFAHALTDAFIAALTAQGAQVGSPLSVIEVLAMGGAIRRSDAGAFAYRDANWLINIPGQWRDPADTPAEIAWVRDTYAALEPHLSGGTYSNLSVGDAYGRHHERLREVKRAYDPENVFRLNQNIAP